MNRALPIQRKCSVPGACQRVKISSMESRTKVHLGHEASGLRHERIPSLIALRNATEVEFHRVAFRFVSGIHILTA